MLLYCLSGFVSLAYQVCWFRFFVDELGSSNLTFVLVLVNFIGGLGIGALVSKSLAGWLAARFGTRDKLQTYGLIELLISAAVLLTVVLGALPRDMWGSFPYLLQADGFYHPTWSYQFGKIALATVCVFLPCFLMGVTFPLLSSAYKADSRFPSRLYAWNTLGACTSVLVCEMVFIPSWGYLNTFYLMLGVNALIGLFFLSTRYNTAENPPDSSASTSSANSTDSSAIAISVLFTCALIGGLLSGALEADLFKRIRFIGFRSHAAMSFISFWAILAIFLASWTVHTIRFRLSWLKAGLVISALWYLFMWSEAYPFKAWLAEWDATGFHADGMRAASKPLPLLAYIGAFAFISMYMISLLLPWVCNQLQASRRHLGTAYGLNTVAFCIGIVAFTWVAPNVNIFYSLKLLIGFFIVAVLLVLTLKQSRVGFLRPFLAVDAVIGLAFLTSTELDTDYFTPGTPPTKFPTRAVKSNGAITTFVLEHPRGDVLFFDSFIMSMTSIDTERFMRLEAHAPLLLQENPRQALLICFGVGNTASAIAHHETIQRVDVVDLNDRVFETAPEFRRVNRGVYEDERVNLIHDDGRNFLNLTDQKYHLITSDPPPPIHDGTFRLYSEEFYQSALAHLEPGGIMSQWLPIFLMPNDAVDMAVRTFVSVFPHNALMVGTDESFILLGSNSPFRWDRIADRFHESGAVADDLRRVGVPNAMSMLARYVMGDATLREKFAGHRTISDRRNDLAYLFHDELRPSIQYDPHRLLGEVTFEQASMQEAFQQTVTDLSQLRAEVPDFPVATLHSVKAQNLSGIRFSDIDWRVVDAGNRRADRTLAAGDRNSAMHQYQQSLERVPNQPRVLSSIAVMYDEEMDHAMAFQTWRKYIEVLPNDVYGHFNMGRSLLNMGKMEEAAASALKAVEIAPRTAWTHKFLGDALANTGQYEEARKAYETAIDLQPGYQSAQKNLGQLLAIMAKKEETTGSD